MSTRYEEIKPIGADLTLEGGEVRYRFSAERNWIEIIFLVLFLGIWTFGGGQMPQLEALFSGDWQSASTLSFMFLAIWFLGSFLVFSRFAWLLLGSEAIVAKTNVLTHTRKIGPLGWSRNFKPNALTNIRWVQASLGADSEHGRVINPPAIKAQYGAKTIHFLAGIDEPDAENLIDHIHRVFGRRRGAPSKTSEGSPS